MGSFSTPTSLVWLRLAQPLWLSDRTSPHYNHLSSGGWPTTTIHLHAHMPSPLISRAQAVQLAALEAHVHQPLNELFKAIGRCSPSIVHQVAQTTPPAVFTGQDVLRGKLQVDEPLSLCMEVGTLDIGYL